MLAKLRVEAFHIDLNYGILNHLTMLTMGGENKFILLLHKTILKNTAIKRMIMKSGSKAKYLSGFVIEKNLSQ